MLVRLILCLKMSFSIDFRDCETHHGTHWLCAGELCWTELAVQLDKPHHCEKIFQKNTSATSGKRPRLEACLEYVREGGYTDCDTRGSSGTPHVAPVPDG